MAARLAPDARSLFKTAGAKARTSRSPPGSPAARCPGAQVGTVPRARHFAGIDQAELTRLAKQAPAG